MAQSWGGLGTWIYRDWLGFWGYRDSLGEGLELDSAAKLGADFTVLPLGGGCPFLCCVVQAWRKHGAGMWHCPSILVNVCSMSVVSPGAVISSHFL